MVIRMAKTTLVIDDGVMARLRARAATEGTTISALVEAALRRFLDEQPGRRRGALPSLPTFHGGRFRVDVADRDVLYDALEGS